MTKHLPVVCALCAFCSALTAAPRLVRQADTSEIRAQRLDLLRGETVDLQVRILNYGRSVSLAGAAITLHGQTNGMAAGESWQLAGTAGIAGDDASASNGWAEVSVPVSTWLPADFETGTWTLEAAWTTPAVRVLRAGGALMVSGSAAADGAAPPPVSVWTSITNAIAVESSARASGDAAVSNYVDTVSMSIGAVYYAVTNASAINSSYRTLSRTPSTTASSISFNTITNGQYLTAGWLTPDLLPSLRDGEYEMHYHLSWSARSHPSATFSTQPELWVYDTGAVVTQRVSVSTSQVHAYGSGMGHFDAHLTVGAEAIRVSPFPALLRIRAVVSGAHSVGGAIGVGGTTQSHFQFPTPSGFFATSADVAAADSSTLAAALAHVGDAARVIQADTNAWVEVRNRHAMLTDISNSIPCVVDHAFMGPDGETGEQTLRFWQYVPRINEVMLHEGEWWDGFPPALRTGLLGEVERTVGVSNWIVQVFVDQNLDTTRVIFTWQDTVEQWVESFAAVAVPQGSSFHEVLVPSTPNPLGSGTIDWARVVTTNSVPLATTNEVHSIGTAIVLSHLSTLPTNAVSGWLVWDEGSNRWWRVSATNLNFYIWAE